MNYIDCNKFFHHPTKNFSHGDFWGDQSEFSFGNHFIEKYHKLSDYEFIAFRELPVPGSGIADLVVVKTKDCKKKNGRKATVLSFEFKLKDWRSGLMQAHRYKYFSNSSILVIPSTKIETALKSIDLFKKLEVGLWAFNFASGAIAKKFTPRPKKISDTKRAAYILEKAFKNI